MFDDASIEKADKAKSWCNELRQLLGLGASAASNAGKAPKKAPPKASDMDASAKLTAERLAVAQRLLDDLKGHPQSASIGGEILAATATLTQARTKAEAGNHDVVKKLLTTLVAEMKAAKTVADRRQWPLDVTTHDSYERNGQRTYMDEGGRTWVSPSHL